MVDKIMNDSDFEAVLILSLKIHSLVEVPHKIHLFSGRGRKRPFGPSCTMGTSHPVVRLRVQTHPRCLEREVEAGRPLGCPAQDSQGGCLEKGLR